MRLVARTPAGRFSAGRIAVAGSAWTYSDAQLFWRPGDYQVWVEALDAAGNRSLLGPYPLKVLAPPRVAKTVTPETDVALGSVVTYTFEVENENVDTDIAGLVISDQLPAEVTPLAPVWGAPYTVQLDGALTWGPLELAAGEAYTLAFTARVTESLALQGATVVNTATFSAPGYGSGVTPRTRFSIAWEPISFVYPDAGDVFTATNGVSATVPVYVLTPYTVLPDQGYWALWGDGALLASPLLTHSIEISLPVGSHVLSATLHTTDTQQIAATAEVAIEVVAGHAAQWLYLSTRTNGTVEGLSFADEDILAFDPDSDTWTILFDGSDVGLGRTDLDAFALLDDDSLLLSLDRRTSLAGLGWVDDSDIVRFIPTSLGESTSGSFEWYLDGSDVGLTRNGEDVDAIALTPEGDLLISTSGNFAVPGAWGQDEDLMLFSPTSLGANTSGSWARYFDGSDVGLTQSSEDVAGAWIDAANGDVYLSTQGNWVVAGINGAGADIFVCTPGSLGADTSCTYSLYWDGSEHGLAGEASDAFTIRRPVQPGNNAFSKGMEPVYLPLVFK